MSEAHMGVKGPNIPPLSINELDIYHTDAMIQ